MSDFKSKLPDLKELGSMTGKLFHGLKSSVSEIIDDYKKKREITSTEQPHEKACAKPATEKAKKTTTKKAAAKEDSEAK